MALHFCFASLSISVFGLRSGNKSIDTSSPYGSSVPSSLIFIWAEGPDERSEEGLPFKNALASFDWRAMRVELDAFISTYNIALN
jgi:hypothetical protein